MKQGGFPVSLRFFPKSPVKDPLETAEQGMRMAMMTSSLATVLGSLFALGLLGWIVFKFLENFQDSANGLTIGQSMARNEAMALSRKERRNTAVVQAPGEPSASGAPGAAKPLSLPLRYVRDTVSPENEVVGMTVREHAREMAVPGNAAPEAAAFKFYPKIVYQCPYATEMHYNVLHQDAPKAVADAGRSARKTG